MLNPSYLAIISAMEEENAALVESMQIESETSIAERIYYSGTLWNQKVVVVFSRWGKVAAAATAVTLIERFNVQQVLFTGVAGAIDKILNVGDVVVADYLYQHDLDVRPILERHEIPLLGISKIAASNYLSKELIAGANQFVRDQLNEQISAEEVHAFSLQNPKVICAAIATGDQFISNAETAADMKSRLPSVVCTEMEGGAVAQVCLEHKIPFAVVRIISDNANDSADVDFWRFVAKAARIYSKWIMFTTRNTAGSQ